MIARYSGRVLMIVLLIVAGLPSVSSGIQLGGIIAGAEFLSLMWVLEHLATGEQLRGIEEGLAKRSGGEWEDVYIRVRYYSSAQALRGRLLRLEPGIWAILVTVVAGARLVSRAFA